MALKHMKKHIDTKGFTLLVKCSIQEIAEYSQYSIS